MSVLDTELPYASSDFFYGMSLIVVSAILMYVFSGYFAAVIPPIVFCWVFQTFYLKTSRQIRLLDLEAKSPLLTQFLDLLQVLSSVRAFDWGARFMDKYLEFLDVSQRPYYLMFCIQQWLALVLDLMVAVFAVILMILAVELGSQFSPTFVALALLNVTSFSQSMAEFIKYCTQLETSIGAISRVEKLYKESKNENLPAEISPVPEHWTSYGHVSIEKLTASYDSDGELVLHNVTIDIAPARE
ncbi:putative p-loop containing nucleoside triphosphate hydrolase protein [Seiridium cardinale]|uniref:P-loop containing nucleoside triphosphate hydrolase protein n=1 Tax=Seiridium cardinale TaxID=138064 RepID=A0ABR2XN74_9PEZI